MVKIQPASLTSQPRIFDFGSASGNSIFLRAAAFTAGFKYNGGTTTLINSSTALTTNQEAKVAMVYDAKTKVTKVYLNGTETASASTILYEPYQLTGIGPDSRNYIGRAQWWDTSEAANNVDFKGTIDDFFLFDIALTQAEIIQLQTSIGNIHNERLNSFKISPNLVEKNSTLKLSEIDQSLIKNGKIEIEIINSVGQKIYNSSIEYLPIQIKSPEKSGLYFVKISSGNTSYLASKLIVK
jgi:hypothetical protein